MHRPSTKTEINSWQWHRVCIGRYTKMNYSNNANTNKETLSTGITHNCSSHGVVTCSTNSACGTQTIKWEFGYWTTTKIKRQNEIAEFLSCEIVSGIKIQSANLGHELEKMVWHIGRSAVPMLPFTPPDLDLRPYAKSTQIDIKYRISTWTESIIQSMKGIFRA